MIITLTPEQAQLVQSQLAASDYKSSEDFSKAALALLTEHDRQQSPTEALDDREEISYNPIPAKRTFTVKARLRFTGRSQPIPYTLNDD
jgi:Arc/MetJ-type ribon-helix-helix transcriptional regulator